MSSCKKKKGLLKAVSPRNRSPGGVVFINNDVEEIRQRRMEAHLRGVMSPGGRPPAFEKFVYINLQFFSLFPSAPRFHATCLK